MAGNKRRNESPKRPRAGRISPPLPAAPRPRKTARPLELHRLTHELQVHQEELEIQNRQLVESQQLLEESRDRLASLYDFAPVPYVTLCNQGVIREINMTGATLLGHPRDRLIDRPFLLFVAEPYRRSFLNHLTRCRKGKGLVTTELVLHLGEQRDVAVELRTSAAALHDPRGPKHLSVLIDISDRQRLEHERERLREATQSERLLRTVLETLPVAVRMVGPQGESLLFNDACRQLWGVPAGAPLLPSDHQKGWEPGSRRRLPPRDWPVARALRGDRGVLSQMIRIQGLDGVIRMVMQSAVPLLDDSGDVNGAVEVTEDVTRLLAAQETATQRQEQLEAAFDAAHLSFWDWDLAADRVTWAGPFERIFTREKNATRMEDFYHRIHADDVRAVRAAVGQSRKKRSGFEAEFRLAEPAAEVRWLSAKGRFAYRGEIATRMTGVMMDITARKNAEIQQRRAKEAAEEASRLRDDFLATVSHELRTPLSAILLWSHLAISTLHTPEEIAEALRTIQHSAKAQSQIIEDLLDISRGVAGKLRLSLQTTALAPAVRAALDGVRPSATARQVDLHVELAEDLPSVHIDPDRIQQVAWNLLTNAIKFARAGGVVSVKAFLHTPSGGQPVARLVVSDNGQGIAPEFLPYIFDRFRQAESGITRTHGGLGLGMAIARELVQMHGGLIRAESAGLGHGATFTVDLPLANASPNDPPATAPMVIANVLRGLNVLVVEDEHNTRAALAKLLQAAGATVRTAPSAEIGLQQFRAQPPDILISDIAMPGQDGYTLLRQIRQLEAAPSRRNGKRRPATTRPPHIPAIALTARARAEDRAQSMAAGFQAHLAKPIEPTALIATVATLCRRKMQLNSDSTS